MCIYKKKNILLGTNQNLKIKLSSELCCETFFFIWIFLCKNTLMNEQALIKITKGIYKNNVYTAYNWICKDKDFEKGGKTTFVSNYYINK